MSVKLEAALKGKFVNVNGEKTKITKLDRANGAYILEDGTVVQAEELTKRGRGLFYAPKRARKTSASAKPVVKTTRASREVEEEAAIIDRELKGRFITLNPGTRSEDKQKIVAIVKGVGYKTEDGTVIPASAVTKKGRGVFAVTGKSKKAESAPAAKTNGLKPKSEIKKASAAHSGGLKPKQQVARRAAVRDEDDEQRVLVKKFTQSIAQKIEDASTSAIEKLIATGKLSNLDITLAAVHVTFENRGLLLEAAFVPGNATDDEVTEFKDKLFGEDGGAGEELDEEELDEEDEELDEDEEEEELDEDEEEEELDEESEEDDEDLDEEDLDEDEEEESEEDDEDLDEDEEESEEDEEESEEEDDSEEEEDFDDEEAEELDEEEEEGIDFDAIAEKIGANPAQVEKYGQLYVDSDFDASATAGNKVRDTRTATTYFFVGSTTKKSKDAKIVLAKKGGKLTTISLNTFATHFEEI